MGVEVLPLSVHFGEEAYLDGVELSPDEFYRKLAEATALPTTSQINPDRFIQTFEEARAAGDQVLGIFISSEMSGTYQSACIARDAVDRENISVIDSRTVTFAMGLLVDLAARWREEGCSLEELTLRITALTRRVRILAQVDTLKYLKMGGRISAATAMVGGLLGICPVVSVEEGKVLSAGKARGRKGAYNWIREELGRRPADLSLPVAFGHSNAPQALEEVQKAFADWSGEAPFSRTGNIGAVVGTHAGPGASGLAYFEKEE